MTTDRTAIRRGLAIRRTAHRPPWGRGKARGHRSIVTPLSATVAATVIVGFGLVLARALERERRTARSGSAPDDARRWGLDEEEPAASGYRRIALGQLDLALELLGDGSAASSSAPPEEAVHETRKALKRVRALIRLLEGELGAKRTKRERAILRDAAAKLAGARDAEVLVSTLDGLMRRHPRKLGSRRGVVELLATLEDERLRARAQTLGDVRTRAQVAEELADVRARVARWQLPAQHSARKLTRPGLRRIYRAGRSARRRADRGKTDSRALHKWRKHVKDLRYAAEILDHREPSAKRSAKRSGRSHSKRGAPTSKRGKRIVKVARGADKLGEVLGEEHDLMLLAERVRSHKPLKRSHKRTRKRLLRAISRRRASLRRQAAREGERLYAHKPKRFVRNMHKR